MFKSRGFAAIVPLLLLGIGLVVAVALVGTQTGFFNRASGFPETGTNPSPWGNEAVIKNSFASYNLGSNVYLNRSLGNGAVIDLDKEFTLEFWFKLNNVNTRQSLIRTLGDHFAVTTFNGSADGHSGPTTLNIKVSNGTSFDVFKATEGVIEPGKWNHFAFSFKPDFQGGSFTSYLNGQSTWTAYQPFGKQLPFSDDKTNIAIASGSAQTSAFNLIDGSIEEFRISNIARYPFNTGPGSYTLPAAPFVGDQNTVGIWHFDNKICNASNCMFPNSSGSLPLSVVGTVPIAPSTIPSTNPTRHLECVNLACVEVDGIGSNQCLVDNDCQLRNYLKNGSFELVKDNGKPAEWKSGSLKDNDKVVTTEYFEGTKSFRFTGKNTTGREALGQLVTVNGSANDIVTLTVRNKSTGAAATGGLAGMAAIITYNDGKVDAGYYTFPKSVHDWRLKKAILVPDEPYKSIVITLLNQNGAANYFVDDVKLTIEPGQESDRSKATPSELPVTEVKKLIVQ